MLLLGPCMFLLRKKKEKKGEEEKTSVRLRFSFFPLVLFPGRKQNNCIFQKHCCGTLICFHFTQASCEYCTKHCYPLYHVASMVNVGNLSRALRNIPSHHSCLFLLGSLNGKYIHFQIKSIVCHIVCFRILQPDFQKILASIFPFSRKSGKFNGIEVRIPSYALRPYLCMYLEISCMKPISVPPDLIPGGK